MNEIILLVDDVQMFIEIEKEYLQHSPVEILTAKDGLEALQVIRDKRPDLVFMDIHMPNMDGIACCRAIKSDASLVNITVVMVTAKGNEDEQNNAFSAGCDQFITKPLDRDYFLSVARSFIPSINRRGKRLQILINATCGINNESFPCTIHDLGIGGAFVACEHFAIPKSIIQLTFTLPDGAMIECQGRIAWVSRDSSVKPIGFGVQFALLTSRANEALTKFIMEDK
jgi:CheY-like chemotaxis protein